MSKANEKWIMENEECKMWKHLRRRTILHFPFFILHFSLLFVLLTSLAAAFADDAPPPNKPNLANDQDAIRARYKRFNLTLQQMAEILRKQDPERADLLFRALGKSQESRIDDQMTLIFGLLNKEQPQLGEAIERQGELVGQLKVLLDLLQSEDRRSEIEKEKQRLQELVKDINKLIGKEKDVRAGTERGDDAKKLTDKQGDVAKDADKLGQKIDKDDATKNGETTPKVKSDANNDSKKSDADGKDQKDDKDKKAGDDKSDKYKEKSDKDKSDKDGSKDGKSQKSDDSKQKPKDGQPQDSPPQDAQPQDDQQEGDPPQDPKHQKTPGRKQLQESREAMQRAIDALKKQKRDNASKEQDEAIRKLMEAKEKIEEIQRQLREEEQKLMLAALEARFKKMLAMQLIIYHDTVRLSKADESEKASVQARSVKLSQAEQEILIDADKALVLLKEEGSSIAFPETVTGIRHDVQSIVGWLRDTNVGELTQAVEKDVIEALEELVEALRKEMEKSDDDKKKQQQQQQQQDDEKSNPLVDQLAELRMLRSLQLRVNRRTKVLSRAFEGEQATEAEAVRQLQDLSGRQSRIQQATSDLVKGKNK